MTNLNPNSSGLLKLLTMIILDPNPIGLLTLTAMISLN